MRTTSLEDIVVPANRENYTISHHYVRFQGYKAQVFSRAHQARCKILKIFVKLPLYQRILGALALAFITVSLILLLVYNKRIFNSLAPLAAKWKDVRGGWLILWALTFLTAFPPIVGYGTTVTISGFVYGFPNGWFIAATATICGSLASFITSRTILSNYVNRTVGRDQRFQALHSVLEHDGLKILCMIRLSPLPYSLSNAAISTFTAVGPISFALATAIASPKLLIHVFIGSRMANLADTDKNSQMNAKTKALNYFSIVAGIIIGASVGWFIYQRIKARTREIEIDESDDYSFDNLSNPLISVGLRHDYGSEGINIESLMNDEDVDMWEGAGNEDILDYHDEVICDHEQTIFKDCT
ncbi:Golgi apparatus membrane protein tvp38 [Golovinomyces cichoracearum]|uniref:Golgi apparatus membrane protein TVP38 n=1 Tax=Golovinomyces cichoracearum TaxID=62708 RepID=A0A420J9A7_9PEZI|nr:Golgi apparatus membrane protein tvp38 [Golovinomyces cichoracearum]